MKRIRIFGPLLALAVWVPIATACLWDSDTLRVEARNKPTVVDIIVGRFERNPPLYYEMRLERVSKVIESNPDDLAAYDDAAVACDRLGRYDDGVSWMEKKHARLILMTPNEGVYKDHLYRYHANIGTIRAHRWLKNGANRGDMTDLKAGRDHIVEAIKINPAAHFGREKYQLMVLEWLISPSEWNEDVWYLPNFFEPVFTRGGKRYRGMVERGLLEDAGFEDAVEGVSGLVYLGSAWQSVDVFHGLTVALASAGDASLEHMASLRAKELLKAGKTSLKAQPVLAVYENRIARGIYEAYGAEEIDVYFTKARAAADRWHQARTDFMLAKMQQGEHPDTHFDFWETFQPPRDAQPPEVPGILTSKDQIRIGVATLLTVVGMALLLRRFWRKRKARRLFSIPT